MSEQNSTPPPVERRIYLGKIVKVRGLRGDLKVMPTTWRPERFEELDRYWVEFPDERVEHCSVKRTRIEKGVLYIRFREFPTRELVEPFVGAEIFIDEADRSGLPEDMYYEDDLIGCEVVCEINGELGKIKKVQTETAQDLWSVEGPKGEVLIPAVKEFVKEVDTSGKSIKVALPEGLIEIQRRDYK